MGLLSLEEYEGGGGVDIELSYAQSLIGQEISYAKEDGSVGTMVVENIKVVNGEVIMGGGDQESVPLEKIPDVETKVDKYEEENPKLILEPDTNPEAEEYNDDGTYEWLGTPPEGYENWNDVPSDIFWKHIGEILKSK